MLEQRKHNLVLQESVVSFLEKKMITFNFLDCCETYQA